MDGVFTVILCDIGNSTFHFLINGKHQKYFMDDELPPLNKKIYFISVNEKATAKLLSRYVDAVNLEAYFTFKTDYLGMGIDRKIACMGLKDGVIVDAGSAITVDIMKEGKHQGGFILPGLRKMHEIYAQISPKLDFDFSIKVNLDKIPQNTKDAISYSILKAIVLPIQEIAHNQPLLLTGGDAKELSTYFINSRCKEDLIFENMKGIINANSCIA